MKNAPALSLGLNVVLLAALVAVWRMGHQPGPTTPAGPTAGAAAPRSRSPVVSPQFAAVPGSDWRNWIEPLRAARVPPEVLADLVRADFDRRWQTRQRALQEQYMRGEIDADALARAGLEHDATLEREWQAALGPAAYRAWDMPRLLQNLALDRVRLTDNERDGIYEIERALRERLRQAEADKLRGTIDQATLATQQQRAQDDASDRIRMLVGEQRAARLQGADDTVGQLRRGLRDLPLSDDQFQALAAVERQWDDARDRLATLQIRTEDPAYAAELARNDQQRRREFARIAGEQALDRYLEATDSRYADLRRHAGAWGLSAAEAEDAFRTITLYETAADDYRRDAEQRAVDPVEVRANIARLQQRIASTLETQLGPAKYDQLRRNGIIPVPPSTSTVP